MATSENAPSMGGPGLSAGSPADARQSGPLLAADGTPLKRKLAQALMLSRVRAFMLVAPLLLFILATFAIPILALLWQGVQNNTFAEVMPRTAEAVVAWDGESEPSEEMYRALVLDMQEAQAIRFTNPERSVARAATRVNQIMSGTRSLFTGSARRIDRVTEAPFRENFWETVGASRAEKWQDPDVWLAMRTAAQSLTPAFYARALDYDYISGQGFEKREDLAIHVKLFVRTLWVSGAVTLLCLALGFPVAYLLATLPARHANLLLILVLLPFWTSLLVRTTSWIAMLQKEGVLNDVFAFVGIVNDETRLQMIYNMTGTLVAMTHILLPFMILPLYSVMKTIAPSYVRAAKSLGASNFTAFVRVYAPQTVPGIGAGCLLVFILSIGYYITPALVGGQDGQLISNIIAHHMQRSLNWSLAAALGGLLMIGVLLLYWAYDRIVGVDNMKLG